MIKTQNRTIQDKKEIETEPSQIKTCGKGDKKTIKAGCKQSVIEFSLHETTAFEQ